MPLISPDFLLLILFTIRSPLSITCSKGGLRKLSITAWRSWTAFAGVMISTAPSWWRITVRPTGITRFVWEGFRLLQELHGNAPLTHVYSNQDSYDPLARIDGADAQEIFWFHCQPNGTPERMTDIEGQVRWEGVNSAWGKLLRESETNKKQHLYSLYL